MCKSFAKLFKFDFMSDSDFSESTYTDSNLNVELVFNSGDAINSVNLLIDSKSASVMVKLKVDINGLVCIL